MGYLARRACRAPLSEPLSLAMLSSRKITRSRTMQAAPTQGMEAVPNESAPAIAVAEEDFTTRLHQVNVERAVSFLNCMERIMFSCTAKGCRGAVSAAAIYYRLGACRGVGCLRATCMAQHRASLARAHHHALASSVHRIEHPCEPTDPGFDRSEAQLWKSLRDTR